MHIKEGTKDVTHLCTVAERTPISVIAPPHLHKRSALLHTTIFGICIIAFSQLLTTQAVLAGKWHDKQNVIVEILQATGPLPSFFETDSGHLQLVKMESTSASGT